MKRLLSLLLTLALIAGIIACATPGRGRARVETADVVVVGAGGAGFAAAMAAHQAGARVIFLEKTGRPGGNTMMAGEAFNSVNPELQSQVAMNDAHRAAIRALTTKPPHDAFEAELQQTVRRQFEQFTAQNRPGLFDSVEWHALQTYNGGDYLGNPDLIRVFTQQGPATREWMTRHGMRWSTHPDPNVRVWTVTGGLWQRANQPYMPMGSGFIDMGERYVQAHSDRITFYADTRATDLIVENGRVTGVRAIGSDGRERVFMATRGVVLTTGGFGANVEMRQKFNNMGDPAASWGPSLVNAKTTNHPAIVGDGILMAERIGANLVGMEWIQLLPSGCLRTGYILGNVVRSVEDRFAVNIHGERFFNEGGRRDYMSAALLRQPQSKMWHVVDSRSYPTLDTRNLFGETMQQLLDRGQAVMADTIEELAVKMNVPPENLRRTVDEFNASVAARSDRFGRTLWREPFDSPPFFAGARVPTVHHTMGGVEINVNAQVINTAGQVIPGLFAAGEVAGGLHGTNRLGGNALPETFIFGRIAGTNAAAGL